MPKLLWLFGSFPFPYKFKNQHVHTYLKLLVGFSLALYYVHRLTWGGIDIFTMWSPPIHEHSMSFHSITSFLFHQHLVVFRIQILWLFPLDLCKSISFVLGAILRYHGFFLKFQFPLSITNIYRCD